VIGEIDPSDKVKYLIVAWDTEKNWIDFSAEGMSCFDAAGVLSIAFGLAADRLPASSTDEYEPEEEE